VCIRLVFSVLFTVALAKGGSGSIEPRSHSSPVAVFVPHELFRDDEFDAVVRILERAKIPLAIVSSDTTAAQGIDGLTIKPEQTLTEINPNDFSALVLVDGSGIVVYWNDSLLWRVCAEFAAAGRFVVGIELAPLVFARAGLLKNRTATVYPDFYCINMLKENGARHRFEDVVVDGCILTASKAEHTGKVIRLLVNFLTKGN